MGQPKQRGKWSWLRGFLQRCRACLLLLVLMLLAGAVYLNQVGLPDFLKHSLQEQLRGHGLELEFSRLRLHWFRGIVGEDLHFRRAVDRGGPEAFIEEAAVLLDPGALRQFRLQVNGLSMERGRVVWSAPETNAPGLNLAIEDISALVRLLPDDRLEVDNLSARIQGASMQVTALLTNVSRLRATAGQARPAPTAEALEKTFLEVAHALTNYQFTSPPNLRFRIHGDVAQLTSLTASLTLSAEGVKTTWGNVGPTLLLARLHPATATNALSLADLQLKVDRVESRWARLQGVYFRTRLSSSFLPQWPTNSTVTLEVDSATTRWGSARKLGIQSLSQPVFGHVDWLETELQMQAESVKTPWAAMSGATLTSRFTHAHSNAIPLSGQAELTFKRPTTSYARAAEVRARIIRHPAGERTPDVAGNMGFWRFLEPYDLDMDIEIDGANTRGVALDRVAIGGRWRTPSLVLNRLDVKTGTESLAASVELDVASRQLRVKARSDLDPARFSPLLGTNLQAGLAQCGWDQPPRLSAEAALTLPAWTNLAASSAWSRVPLEALAGRAEVDLDGPRYRNVRLLAVSAKTAWTNGMLDVPDLVVRQPEGRLWGTMQTDLHTRRFAADLECGLSLLVLKPAFSTQLQRVFDLIRYPSPPAISGRVEGVWGDWPKLTATAEMKATNITFRGETAESIHTQVHYSNQVVRVLSPKVRQGKGMAEAAEVTIDIPANRIVFREIQGNIDAYSVTRAIGAKTAAAVAPYRFAVPADVRLNGSIPLDNDRFVPGSVPHENDMRFHVQGGSFQWLNFRLKDVDASVHWLDETLTITNARTEFYGGRLTGSAGFDLTARSNTIYSFSVAVTNSQLQPMLRDLTSPTNPLSGTLSGELTITRADTASPMQSWQGFGRLELHQGLIWDAPVLGIFSTILDGIIPGLGYNRATDVAGSFGITNSVIHTANLGIRSTGVRLRYRGTVDFFKQVDARVEGELMRDTWLVGRLVSTVFMPLSKIFEYRVTGTLAKPVAEPSYLPARVLLLPLEPLKLLKAIFTPSSPPAKTPPPDSPPETPPVPRQ